MSNITISKEALEGYTDFINEWGGRTDFNAKGCCQGMITKLERYLKDPSKEAKFPKYAKMLERYKKVLLVIDASTAET